MGVEAVDLDSSGDADGTGLFFAGGEDGDGQLDPLTPTASRTSSSRPPGCRSWFLAPSRNAPYGIVCLTGVSSDGHPLEVDAGAMNRAVVLENDVVIGSVNANRRHFTAAAAPAAADPS